MPRVFITNVAGHDFSKAEKFGEITWITKGWVPLQSLDRIKFLVTEKLVDVKPEDFLLLSGTQVVCVVAALVWHNKLGYIKMLVHDKKEDDYRILVVGSKDLDYLMTVSTNVERDDRTEDNIRQG